MAGGFFHVALLPPPPLGRYLTDLSGQLARMANSSYELGPGAHPHLTLAQVEADTSEHESLRAKLLPLFNTTLTVDLAGYYASPAADGGHWWVGISVKPTEKLASLQQQVASTLGRPLHNASGASFFPHFTLGRVNHIETLPPLVLDAKMLGMRDIPCLPAFGRSGPHFQLHSLLAG